jgi:hypothetical protein
LVLAVLVVVLGFFVFEQLGTAWHEHRAQRHLSAQFAATEVSPRPPTSPVPGGPFGLLSVPRLGISGEAVVEGATIDRLRDGPAHDSLSRFPGQAGAVVLVGHRQSYGGPFGRLGDLRIGDVISLRTRTGLFAYRVNRDPKVLHSSLRLPSAAEVHASGGSSAYVGQALVLATGSGSGDAPLEVVVATLDQTSVATAQNATPANTGETILRTVPGQRAGLLLAILWLLVPILTIRWAPRLRGLLPLPVLSVFGVLVGFLAMYQMYLALDRLLPGTY